MPRQKGDTRLDLRLWILDYPWPDWCKDFVGKPNARALYACAQEEYYKNTQKDGDPGAVDAHHGAALDQPG